MGYVNPSIADFKAYFTRDFPYGTDPETSILDGDIAKAFTFANMSVNVSFFSDQASYTAGYMYLAAHNLVKIIRAGGQGVNGQYNFLQSSKGVGSVNESFAIPQRILDIPAFAMLTKTNYGAQYLEMILPQLVGQVRTVHGHTKA